MPRVESILRLNTSTNLLLMSNQKDNDIKNFAVNLIDQSFKNILIKKTESENYTIDDLIEICANVKSVNKNLFVLQQSNCYLADGRVDNLLYDKICDTLTVVKQQKLDSNLVFLFNNEDDINNIFKMDIYITVEIANIIINNISTKRYTNFMDFISDIPLVRMKYIF
jgi:hypothetical protein